MEWTETNIEIEILLRLQFCRIVAPGVLQKIWRRSREPAIRDFTECRSADMAAVALRISSGRWILREKSGESWPQTGHRSSRPRFVLA
jgi:hypothetical protein